MLLLWYGNKDNWEILELQNWEIALAQLDVRKAISQSLISKCDYTFDFCIRAVGVLAIIHKSYMKLFLWA